MEAAATFSLIDLDPELAGHLAAGDLARLRQRTQLPTVALEPGDWVPEAVAATANATIVVVLDGLLVRELVLAGTPTAELLGAGDIAAIASSEDEFLPTRVRWTAVSAARVALVDRRLNRALQAWPDLAAELFSRAAQQASRLALQRAMAHLPRVEDRLLALFWHLAERWGRVGTTGVIVPLSLTHTMLGRLVGARRPTVSLALKELEQQGSLARRSDGSWVISLSSLSLLQAEEAEALTPPGVSLVTVADNAGEASARSNRAAAEDLPPMRLEAEAIYMRVAELRAAHDARREALTASYERARRAIAASRALRSSRGWKDPFSPPAP